jgi:phage baseplate assembly protein W
MISSRRNPPFYGRGIAFTFRLNPATGGVEITEGNSNDLSVNLEIIRESGTAREIKVRPVNHIAEAIAHILLTMPGEHDTLPEFGSRVYFMLNKPNHFQTRKEFEVWAVDAIKRWERRVSFAKSGSVEWFVSDYDTDNGILPVALHPQFIASQTAGNLVSPFVTPRQARAQEYPLGDSDAEGYDWCSRYRGSQVYELNGVRMIRPRISKPLPPRSDDWFYEVGLTDTWLLISWKAFRDIRFWWAVAEMFVQDAAERGEPVDAMDTTGDPEVGTLLRMPSRARLLMEIAV